MTNEKKFELLNDVFDVEEGTLTPETALANLNEWDSMTKLSLIVMMDDEFSKSITGAQIRALVTVGDILNLME